MFFLNSPAQPPLHYTQRCISALSSTSSDRVVVTGGPAELVRVSRRWAAAEYFASIQKRFSICLGKDQDEAMRLAS